MIKIISQITEHGSVESDTDLLKSPRGLLDSIDKFTVDYTQTKWSLLHQNIKSALDCDDTKATYLAKRVCKVWCLWLELYSKKFITQSFAQFFQTGVGAYFIDRDTCELQLEQVKVFGTLQDKGIIERTGSPTFIEIHNLYKFQSYALTENWTGTIRIETKKDHFHSIPSYNLNGIIKMSDISYRGQRVDPWLFITPDTFRYFTSFKEG